MRAKPTQLTYGLQGEQYLMLRLRGDFREEYQKLADQECDFEIKLHRSRRSRDANAYCWVLIGKIAEALSPPLPKEEVYLTMLKRYGQGGVISIEKKNAESVKRTLDYYDEKGESELNGKTFVHFHTWIGSSKYDTKEMALLIDGIVADAQELGIDTDTPEQVARYKEEWHR